jgi:hypothetical protein
MWLEISVNVDFYTSLTSSRSYAIQQVTKFIHNISVGTLFLRTWNMIRVRSKVCLRFTTIQTTDKCSLFYMYLYLIVYKGAQWVSGTVYATWFAAPTTNVQLKRKPYQEDKSTHPQIFHNENKRRHRQLSCPSINYILIYIYIYPIMTYTTSCYRLS